MAVTEVIYFSSGAQLSMRPLSPARIPPEPVAESPPQGHNSRRNVGTRTPQSPCSARRPRAAVLLSSRHDRGGTQNEAWTALSIVHTRVHVIAK